MTISIHFAHIMDSWSLNENGDCSLRYGHFGNIPQRWRWWSFDIVGSFRVAQIFGLNMHCGWGSRCYSHRFVSCLLHLLVRRGGPESSHSRRFNRGRLWRWRRRDGWLRRRHYTSICRYCASCWYFTSIIVVVGFWGGCCRCWYCGRVVGVSV